MIEDDLCIYNSCILHRLTGSQLGIAERQRPSEIPYQGSLVFYYLKKLVAVSLSVSITYITGGV